MRSYITYEQLDALIRFANGETTAIDLEVASALNSLNASVQGNVIKELTGARKRNRMLTDQINKKKEERRQQFENGKFDESRLDSADVANALLYQLQQLKTWKLTKYKVITILYEMYASWLYSKGERICEEHPVATQWGPRFWHAIKLLEPGTPVSYDFWKSFAEKRPDVAAFCKNAALKYYDITESTLVDIFINTKAFKNAHADNNGGKWNKEIADADIYLWKKHADKSANKS